MKRTLFLAALLACCMTPHAVAAVTTYNNLGKADSTSNSTISYDGTGNFAFNGANNTEIILTVDLNAYNTYVNSESYSGDWFVSVTSVVNGGNYTYGLVDNRASASDDSTAYLPCIIGKYASNQYASEDTTTGGSFAKYYGSSSEQSTLTITISFGNGSINNGITVTTEDGTRIYKNTGMTFANTQSITNCYVNTNYVTSVTLNSGDYSQPFESQRDDNTSIGRVTFIGDSITHGVNDMSYRWQLFKILTDNGIENEIAGPRNGHYSQPNTRDAGAGNLDLGAMYGGKEFANVHLAHASGRTRNVINGRICADPSPAMNIGTGVTYGGWSSSETAASFDSDTWFCMMGTNDLLSDTYANGNTNDKNDITTENYCGRMQVLLGGSVSFTETGEEGSKIGDYTWTRTGTDSWGNMGTIVNDVCGQGDTFYMLSIIPWGPAEGALDGNHDLASDRLAVREYNENLKVWCAAYSEANDRNVVYVDVTHGMVDHTGGQIDGKTDLPFYAPNQFFNTAITSDDIHPCEQGALLMAGNLARAMNQGGRTAGLQRQSSENWTQFQTVGGVSDGSTQLLADGAFSVENGYTVDFNASFGNGAADGWLSIDNALSITVGDGSNSGTLRLTEGYIMWGDDTLLFCWDTSSLAGWDADSTKLSADGNLRIAWHNGSTADNVLQGYYVWLDDMLIGQGLSHSSASGFNGIKISAAGAAGIVSSISWTDTAYAPTSLGMYSAENALITTQDISSISSGIDFSSIEPTTGASGGTHLVGSSTGVNANKTFVLGDAASWVTMSACRIANYDVNVQATGSTGGSIIGVYTPQNGAGQVKDLRLEIIDGATIKKGQFSDDYHAIIGSLSGGRAESFNVYMEGGTVEGDIVGGAVGGAGNINNVKLVIKGGTVNGDVYGGSKSAGTVGKADIIVMGGTVTGSINAGGKAGTIGNTHVHVSGGTITGDILMGTAESASTGREAIVTLAGNEWAVGGRIEADRLVFDQVKKDITNELTVQAIDLLNKSSISVTFGENRELDSLSIGADSIFSAYKNDTNRTAVSEAESTLTLGRLSAGSGAVLNANIVFTEGSILELGGTLTMGSDVALVDGMVLELSESMLRDLYGYNPVVLFTGVDNLTLNGEVVTEGAWVNVDGVFTNLNPAFHYHLSYVGSNVTLIIPEPTTATLSLLALASLAARRRRKA